MEERNLVIFCGTTCVDVILRAVDFPAEDTKSRLLGTEKHIGGNVANSSLIFAWLEKNCSFSVCRAGELSGRSEACTATTSVVSSTPTEAGKLAIPSANTLQAAVFSIIPSPDVDKEALWVRSELERGGVAVNLIAEVGIAGLPTSYIITTETTTSRTILHHRGIPEYCWEDMKKQLVDPPVHGVGKAAWVHVEGRCVSATRALLQHIHSTYPITQRPIISLELERIRPDGDIMMELAPYAPLVFVSAEYAKTALHATNPKDSMRIITDAYIHVCARNHEVHGGAVDIKQEAAILVCPWGEEGAFTSFHCDCELHHNMQFTQIHIPAHSPSSGCIVDTIAAGDTFNAAFIWVMSHTWHDPVPRCRNVVRAIQFATVVAGEKVGLYGLDLADAKQCITRSWRELLLEKGNYDESSPDGTNPAG